MRDRGRRMGGPGKALKLLNHVDGNISGNVVITRRPAKSRSWGDLRTTAARAPRTTSCWTAHPCRSRSRPPTYRPWPRSGSSRYSRTAWTRNSDTAPADDDYSIFAMSFLPAFPFWNPGCSYPTPARVSCNKSISLLWCFSIYRTAQKTAILPLWQRLQPHISTFNSPYESTDRLHHQYP